MKFRFNTHYNTIAAYVLIVFALALALVSLVFRFGNYWVYVLKIIDVLAPVIWGIVIAYLLCPLLNFFEKWVARLTGRRKPHPTFNRVTGIFISIGLMLLLIVGIVYAVIPEIITSLKSILVHLPDYLSNLQDYLNDKLTGYVDKNPEAKDFLESAFGNIETYLLDAANQFQPKLDSLVSKDGILASVTSSAFSLLLALKDFCLGIIVSVYLLFSKEKFLAQLKKLVHATLSRVRCERLFRIAGQANYTFMHFLSGKALDSFIIGMLCFIGLTIIKAPYIVLISIIIGITNMIPFFGPFIGAVPAGLLILLSEPTKTIPFVIFIFLLQQFDGNILGPKILGSSLGLSPFWIMFAIFVGGGLFGFIGMVAFVPLFAVLYALLRESVNNALTKKKLPLDSDTYIPPGTRYTAADKPVTLEVVLDTGVKKAERSGKEE